MFWTVTKRILSIPEEEHIVAGLSLGFGCPTSSINDLKSKREPLASFISYHAD